MQAVAEWAGLVAAVDRPRLDELGLDPLAKPGRRELLRRLRRAVVQDPDHDDRVGMDIQSQLDGLRFDIRDLLHANFGVIEVWSVHCVGGCSAFALARQLLMSSPNAVATIWHIRTARSVWSVASRNAGPLFPELSQSQPVGLVIERSSPDINLTGDGCELVAELVRYAA